MADDALLESLRRAVESNPATRRCAYISTTLCRPGRFDRAYPKQRKLV